MGARRVDQSQQRTFLERENLALKSRLSRVEYLLPEFTKEVLHLPWCLISGPSTLSQFTILPPIAELRTRIERHYRTTIGHLPDDRIITILEHVQSIRA